LKPPSTDEWGSVVESFNAMLRRADLNLGRLKKQEMALQSQLHQAQKMEAIGRLTSGVAHDFNNLLTIVLGNAEMLEDINDAKVAKLVKPVIRAALRGSELTQRLLSFSRRGPQPTVAADLGALVTGLGVLLSHTLSETVELEFRACDDLWKAIVDPGQMENALLNLAFNAQHAMPRGGKLVIEAKNVSLDADYVSRHSGARQGDYVLIAARDTGSGIPPEVLEHVFEPFFTTKEAGKGSGLGLSMVHDFVEQSGGHVALESQLGEGTEIRLYLPRAKDPRSGIESAPSPSEILTGDRQRVLVVEDDPDVRELTVAMLESLGYAVVATETGSAGLQILRDDSKLDVLLSDMVLPGGMSGVELIAEARRRLPGLRVVLMSGYVDSAVERPRLPADVALLPKPFDRHDLSLRLRASLNVAE
jgi:signal transduction histidine kinase